MQDVGEPGLANVTVRLYDSDDNLIATTMTDSNGNYLFTDVPTGDYYVAVDVDTLPDGLVASPGSYTGAEINLLSGESHLDADFGYVPATGTAVIGDFIWADANGDGIQDPGEIGIASVTVTLKDSNGDTVAATTTGPDGSYYFTNVDPGTYTVVVDTANFEPGGPLDGYTVTSGLESEGANTSRAITVLADDVITNVDFGYDNPTLWSISDRLWYDADRDGLFDAGESGIGGVAVNLLDEDGNVIATVITNPDGTFTFSGVPNGNYTIQIADNTNQLGGYQYTTPDADAGYRAVTVMGADVTSTHFGYAGLGPIGDTIFSDHDGDCIQDPGEIGIAGVTVELYYDANGDGIFDPDTDAPIATAVTDAGGNYLFNDLPAGTFFVVVDPATLPSGYTQTGDPDATLDHRTTVTLTPTEVSFLDADFGYQNTTLADISGSIWNDLNRNARDDGAGEPPIAGVTVALLDSGGTVVATTVTDSNGDYTFYDVPAGNYTVAVTDDNNILNGYQLTSGLDAIPVTVAATDITGVDFGYVRNPATGVIGDRIWHDANRDGVQNGGEGGIANVTVALKAAATIIINGVTYNTGDTIATTTTDLNGNYLFTGLPAGSYTVDVDGTTLPSGLAATTGTTDPLTVNLNHGQVYLDADFGYASSAGSALGDRIWHDYDGDGVQDPGEPGIGGATVVVTGPTCPTGCTVVTDPDGSWLLTGLAEGCYTVVVAPPAGYNTTPTNWPTASQDFYVLPNTDVLYADFGFKLPTGTTYATIGDRIWLDADGDGAQDTGETGIPGVTVNLVNASGVIIATTTTDANGSYLFSGVPDGSYTVRVSDVNNVLAGRTQTGDPDSTKDNATAVVVSGGDVTSVGGTACTDCNLNVDFGYQPSGGVIGNHVWRDLDGDGFRDADEPGVEGVTINLWLDVNGDGIITPGVDNLIRTTVTDANGQYQFRGLPYGKYLVDVTDKYGVLGGMTLTDGTDNTDNYSQPDPYAVELTLTGGIVSSDYTADFGYTATTPLTISGIVFSDTNNNGSWATGEPYVPGATLSLYRVVNGEWFLIGTTTSASDGSYSFTDLPAGDYMVVAQVGGTEVGGKFQTTQTTTKAVQPVTLTTANSTNNDFGFYSPPVSPTSVDVVELSVTVQGEAILVVWETAQELDSLGFNLSRSTSANGPWAELNVTLIAAQVPGSPFGSAYEWLDDENVEPDVVYFYRLEQIDTRGSRTFFGPVTAVVHTTTANQVYNVFLPLVLNNP